jgi:hypothetical protein
VRELTAATATRVYMQGATVRVEEAAGSGHFCRELCRGEDNERRNAEAGSGVASRSSRTCSWSSERGGRRIQVRARRLPSSVFLHWEPRNANMVERRV